VDSTSLSTQSTKLASLGGQWLIPIFCLTPTRWNYAFRRGPFWAGEPFHMTPRIPPELPFEDRLVLVLLWRIHLASGDEVQRVRSRRAFDVALRRRMENHGA
jgi:hypothetical protein